MSVNKEAIRKWVDALRSGEYQQGRAALQPEPGYYCCLGVACEVFKQETGTGVWQHKVGHQYPHFVLGNSAADGTLPHPVAAWLFGGDADASPAVVDDADDGDELWVPCHRDLTYLNDNGRDFARIADLIEREWLSA